jgi:hypothetical protein
MRQKKIPIPVRYAINSLLFAVFLFVGYYMISSGAVSKYFAKVIVLIGINIILAVTLKRLHGLSGAAAAWSCGLHGRRGLCFGRLHARDGAAYVFLPSRWGGVSAASAPRSSASS